MFINKNNNSNKHSAINIAAYRHHFAPTKIWWSRKITKLQLCNSYRKSQSLFWKTNWLWSKKLFWY